MTTTVQPTPNVELLRRTLAHIEAHPETWDQSDWRRPVETVKCGTAMCFAGWAAQLAGGKWLTDASERLTSDALIAERDEVESGDAGLAPDGTAIMSARARAMRVLGLNEGEAHDLFDGENDLPRIRAIVDDLCGGSAS